MHGLRHRGIDRAGRDRVDADAAHRKLQRELLGQVLQRGFAGGPQRRPVARQREQRPDVDLPGALRGPGRRCRDSDRPDDQQRRTDYPRKVDWVLRQTEQSKMIERD